MNDGEQITSVVGGFHSGKVTKKGTFEQQFNLAGEYKFARYHTMMEFII